MDAFIFAQRYNSLATRELRAHNDILCTESGRAPHGVTPTHCCDAGAFRGGIPILRRAQEVKRPPLRFDNRRPLAQVREEVFQALSEVPNESLELVAYFGHGMPGGLVSAGIGRAELPIFATLLLNKCRRRANIVFYACLTGQANGFAQELAARLTAKDLWVYGHIGTGNYADLRSFRRYPGGLPYGGEGRIYGFFNRDRERQAREAQASAGGPEHALYG